MSNIASLDFTKYVKNCRDNLSAKVEAKGVSVTGTETLRVLTNKVSDIPQQQNIYIDGEPVSDFPSAWEGADTACTAMLNKYNEIYNARNTNCLVIGLLLSANDSSIIFNNISSGEETDYRSYMIGAKYRVYTPSSITPFNVWEDANSVVTYNWTNGDLLQSEKYGAVRYVILEATAVSGSNAYCDIPNVYNYISTLDNAVAVILSNLSYYTNYAKSSYKKHICTSVRSIYCKQSNIGYLISATSGVISKYTGGANTYTYVYPYLEEIKTETGVGTVPSGSNGGHGTDNMYTCLPSIKLLPKMVYTRISSGNSPKIAWGYQEGIKNLELSSNVTTGTTGYVPTQMLMYHPAKYTTFKLKGLWTNYYIPGAIYAEIDVPTDVALYICGDIDMLKLLNNYNYTFTYLTSSSGGNTTHIITDIWLPTGYNGNLTTYMLLKNTALVSILNKVEERTGDTARTFSCNISTRIEMENTYVKLLDGAYVITTAADTDAISLQQAFQNKNWTISFNTTP